MENVREASFELTLEDIHAFNQHYASTARAALRARSAARFGLTFLLSALLLTAGVLSRAPLWFWGLGVAILLMWFFAFPRRVDTLMRRHTERMYADGKNRGLLGSHKVALDDTWLVETTSERDIRTRWTAVERFEATPEHLFIYVSGFSAVIVPRRAFASLEEARAFEEAVRARLAAPC